jgi:hypothetical protein|tara:strand:+ start:229 stop:351 length:123 start_codon:yes stop_codon:yes gene_type:complete
MAKAFKVHNMYKGTKVKKITTMAQHNKAVKDGWKEKKPKK